MPTLLPHISRNLAKQLAAALAAYTWGSVPGGAIDSHETPVEAALREFDEEMGPIPSGWTVRGIHKVDPLPGVWSYYTCCADVSERLDYDETLSWESDAARWFTESELREVELFAPFATVFPKLRAIFEN